MKLPTLSVSDFLASVNQTLEYSYSQIAVEGEVASFKVNQNKFVFFDLKDDSGTVSCFMTIWQLRTPLENGMKVVVTAQPKVTAWGKFSLTIQSYRPSGEGALRKSFELLRAKLDAEGLFAAERKRSLPAIPSRVAVISSTQAAGYTDFITILEQRWGGLELQVAHTQVQGEAAADQMIRAIRHFNEQPEIADALVIIRGGGSVDDLAAFNDEKLVREIAASRIPTMVGVGHEVDTTLADMVADVRAATPSNAAQLLVPDRKALIESVRERVRAAAQMTERSIDQMIADVRDAISAAYTVTVDHIDDELERNSRIAATLRAYDPSAVLERGYALVRGQVAIGSRIEIETARQLINAEVQDVKTK